MSFSCPSGAAFLPVFFQLQVYEYKKQSLALHYLPAGMVLYRCGAGNGRFY